MKCDVIASGIVNAAKQVALKVPVVVRLERTNVDQGKRILKVVEAFKILTSDDKVKAILVNIFGGIMKCDVIASGIVNAAKQVALKVPVVVSLERTNVDQGKRILKESGMTLITAEDLDDVAKKAVKAASK
ncbi:succinate--CoA ligase [ADP-forming] subunit beta, mitochondrial-like [Gossypium arboreum]|nr:succinate--CoA ligase [ADP-forming] subunit beta, mitochondrial-like [Gossypium arboreum]XP_052875618.1 succinate--CoA ligase [ADP-forming] subunit beta, mitochondrial-like [Gossypium arboreum]XP_052875619.1 succinate--CoA ligase [ADP-forming] subunit beta, mitochondrial-like [Gossypium arboreum]